MVDAELEAAVGPRLDERGNLFGNQVDASTSQPDESRTTGAKQGHDPTNMEADICNQTDEPELQPNIEECTVNLE